MTVSRRGSVSGWSPRRNRAAPTPPASTVIRDRTRPADPSVQRRPLHRIASHGPHEGLDLLDGRVFARVRPGLAGDALFHERTTEVVAPGAERELREAVAELHPRRLQVVDDAPEHESRHRV